MVGEMEHVQEQTARLRVKALLAEREVQAKAARRKQLTPLRILAHRKADEIVNQLADGEIDAAEAEAQVRVFVAIHDSNWDLSKTEMDHLERLVRERAGIPDPEHVQ